jgi:hypothetical protein
MHRTDHAPGANEAREGRSVLFCQEQLIITDIGGGTQEVAYYGRALGWLRPKPDNRVAAYARSGEALGMFNTASAGVVALIGATAL